MSPRSELDKVRLNLDGAIRILQAVAEDLAKLQRTVVRESSPSVNDVDAPGEDCTTCGTSLKNGEGYDGLCGSCADRREVRGEECYLEAVFEDRVNGGFDKAP